MFKNKTIMIIMTIFVLGAVLLTGCGGGADKETGIEEKPKAADSANPGDKEEIGSNEDTGSTEATTAASGTLKAINTADGTVVITTEGGNELVLKITNASKILGNDSLAAGAKLDNVIGSKVSVEYHAETNTVKVINILDNIS